MKQLVVVYFTLLLGVFLLVSCTRFAPPTQGELQAVELEELNAIPLEFGSLVGVTAKPDFPRWAQLWFTDDNKTIRVVSVGFFDKKILKNVTVIPRN